MTSATRMHTKPLSGSSTSTSHVTVTWKQAFRRRLLPWYRRHLRDLPWRRTRDPYAVWVSEIMLQQTQVATVIDYFTRFMATFPTIAALAAAEERQVLRLWEGLGYYRRARQLHAAAQVIVREHGGQFPRDPEQVRSLPGIGRYTAGAVLSIAFDAREPILEANTYRLLARLAAYRGDPQSTEGQRILWQLAEDLLPRSGVGAFNQALMELGSLVCTPREPRCDACPVMSLCPTFAQGLQKVIPRVKAKPPSEAVHEAAVLVRRRGQVLLVQCGDDGRWAGLWDFPRFRLDVPRGTKLPAHLTEQVAARTGVQARIGERLTTLKHGVTRFRITLDAFAADYVSADKRSGADVTLRWVKPADLHDYPLSVTGRKLSKLLAEAGGKTPRTSLK